ncbi:MAG TPA: serine hydrolase domain-containing protein [Candidatus Dormibacteraeota bacterium]|nr:serine hydrolase domain-containing protein [Candidatus Dormibacteraeota bacterium]
MPEPTIHGECATRFRRVREVFEENFRRRREIGAAVAVLHDGDTVVDLWAGWADQAKTQPWQRDTIANVYSCTKAMAALCAHQLVERGRLDLDTPVAAYWPEFAQRGKQRIPVRWLLSHRAGLPAVREILPPESLYDWNMITAALAAEEPWWEPGTAHGYHAVTFGWLVGEVVRRIDGRSLGTYFRDEIARPLGLDFHIGLDEGEHARVAELSDLVMAGADELDPEALGLAQVILADPDGMAARAFMNPPSLAFGVNNAEWRSAEIPGANGHAGARDLARVYGALARGGDLDGVHVLAPAGIARLRAEQSHGPDLVLQVNTRFGLGVMLPQDRPDAHFGPSPNAFGHPGAGGAVGFADPDGRIGFGYTPNRLGPHILLDPRATALIEATYES